MYTSVRALSTLLVWVLVSAAVAEEDRATRADRKRAKIDKIAQETLSKLFSQDAHARDLYDDAYGYAVFQSIKVALGISGGGGSGVAVDKGTGSRTYMKMGTGGIGIGLGGQRYQVVFLFETKETLEDFILVGWQGDASAHAVAGTEGKNAETTFTKGLAIFQSSDKGLMLHADVAGTKYWSNKKLNR